MIDDNNNFIATAAGQNSFVDDAFSFGGWVNLLNSKYRPENTPDNAIGFDDYCRRLHKAYCEIGLVSADYPIPRHNINQNDGAAINRHIELVGKFGPSGPGATYALYDSYRYDRSTHAIANWETMATDGYVLLKNTANNEFSAIWDSQGVYVVTRETGERPITLDLIVEMIG